jgi:hypothetical protein
MVAQVRYSMAQRSKGRVAPCAVCTWHVDSRSAGFLVEPQNQSRRFVSGLASKPLRRFLSASKPVATVSRGLALKPAATVFAGLASKPVAMVFAGLASQPAVTVFSSLASKLVVTVSPSLASKPVVSFLVEPQNQGGGGFLGLGHQNWQLRFGDLGVKITATVFWFGPQNQVSFGLSVASQNRWREVDARHASRSSGLFGVKASLARVS